MIHAGNVDEVVKSQRVFRKLADLADDTASETEGFFSTEVILRCDRGGETDGDLRGGVGGAHDF